MRQLGREHIILAEGVELVNFNKMVALNESAAYLWESVVDRSFTVEDLKCLLLERYEVGEETAASDAAKLAQSWIDAGLIEEQEVK